MKYGFVLPRGDARIAADLAYEAELSGWDGFFVWEPIWGVDAWVALTAAAMRTERICLGTMLSPLSRMRPWKIASEAATLDNLSNGRVVLSVGLGALDTGFADFGEETERKTRAELLDESLEIITLLWKGAPFSFSGKHYQIHYQKSNPGLPEPPLPIQKPRIPIWAVGAWKSKKSFNRVMKYDGLLPAVLDENKKVRMSPPTPSEIRVMREYIASNRSINTPFDIIVEGRTPGNDTQQAQSIVMPYDDAGATWWIEALWDNPDLDTVFHRVRQGPPRLML